MLIPYFRSTLWVSLSVFAMAGFLLGEIPALAQPNFSGVINTPPTAIEDFSTIGPHATLNIFPGAEMGLLVESFADTVINLLGGTLGDLFIAHSGTVINVEQGTVSDSILHAGSVMNVRGGSVDGPVFAGNGSLVNISDGYVANLIVDPGSVVNIEGGVNEILTASGGEINIRGGFFTDGFVAGSESEMNFFGTDFLLNGVPLDDLTFGAKSIVLDRGVFLSGTFADGTAFSFELNSDPNSSSATLVDAGALISVVLVPEPASLTLFVIAGVMLPRRRQMR